MKKYKVTFYLMVNPSKGDETIKQSYEVEAKGEGSAYVAAEKLLDAEPPELSKKSVFNYKVKPIE